MTTETPGPENDYGRSEVWGNDGIMPWTPLLEGDGLSGLRVGDEELWSREEDTIVVSPPGDHQHADLWKDGDDWTNYELKVQTTLVTGAMIQIRVRNTENGFYQLGMMPGLHAFQLGMKSDDGRQMLDSINHVVEKEREYHIQIACRGSSITSYIDGQLVNRVTDHTHPRGGIGIGVWGRRTEARFRSPMVRLYE